MLVVVLATTLVVAAAGQPATARGTVPSTGPTGGVGASAGSPSHPASAPTPENATHSPEDETHSPGNATNETPVRATPTATVERYRSVVVFRNDDPQPGWRTDAFVDVNELFVEESVPMTLGVIPTDDEGAHPPGGWFCSRLRTLLDEHPDLFEVAQHGTDHSQVTDFYGGSEFGGLPAAQQRERIERGRRALTRCVDRRPRTFVAPFNSYDRVTADELAAQNFTMVSGGNVVADHFGRDGLFRDQDIYHAMTHVGMVDSWRPVSFHDREYLRQAFDRRYRQGRVHVQMLHYQHFSTEKRLDRLRWFVGYARDHDVHFTTLGSLARGLESDRVERTRTGFLVREQGSTTGRLAGEGDRTVHSFDVEGTGTLAVDLDAPADADFDVYAATGESVPTPTEYDRHSATPGDDSLRLDVTGVDHLRVLVSARSGAGNYSLSVGPPASDSPGEGDEGEGGEGEGGEDDCPWWLALFCG